MKFMKQLIRLNRRWLRLPLVGALLLTAACRHDDDRDLLPPPGYALPGFVSLSGDGEAQFTSGWHQLESDAAGQSWRWMSKRGEIQLHNQGSEMKLRIGGWAPTELLSTAPTMRVSINGHELESFTAPKGHFMKTWTVPRASQKESEKSVLLIETSIAAKPPEDNRELGYALTQLVWEPRATKP
jgi:hypothetical protein